MKLIKTTFNTRFLGILFLIVTAVFLRVYRLSDLPSGFQNDEASFFYNALLFANTGHDEDGRSWPFYLNSYIDPKPALISYLQIPFIWIWGDSVLAARLPGALFGAASLGLLLKLLSLLKMQLSLRWLMVSLLTISPWHVVMSRSTQEVIISFFFGLTALIYLLLLLKENRQIYRKWIYLFSFCVAFLLSIYTYHSAKVVLPVLLLIIVAWQGWWNKKKGTFIGLALVVFLMTGIVLLGGREGLDRFSDIGLFSGTEMQAVITEQTTLATDKTPFFMIRALHNKVVYLGLAVAKNYFSHLTAAFLFFSGGEPQRYAIPFHGLFYHVELILLVLGIVVSARRTKKSRHITWLFLFWLALAPLPAAVTTQEIPSTIRSFWMIVPLYYFIALGVGWVGATAIAISNFGWKARLQKLFLLSILVAGYLWGIVYGWHQWDVFQTYYHPWHRNYADQRMAHLLTKYQSSYDEVIITRFSGQPYIYLALAGLISHKDLQQTYPLRMKDTYSLGKYLFISSECPLSAETNRLFVIRENCYLPPGYVRFDVATYMDGNDGYAFVEWKQKTSE